MTVAAIRTTGFSEVFPAGRLRTRCESPAVSIHTQNPRQESPLTAGAPGDRFLCRQTGNSSRHPLPGIRIFLICVLANSTEKWYYL